MHADRVLEALLSGFGCLDQLETRIGPLGLDLDSREPGPFWSPLTLPRDARAALPWHELVKRLELRFLCDPYHYSPGSLADRLGSRPISSYLASLIVPRAEVERRLRAKLGTPRVTTQRDASGNETSCQAFGEVWRFFLRDAPDGALWIEYGASTPEYAVQERNPSVLHDFLRALPTTVASLSTAEDWKAFSARIPLETGIRASHFDLAAAPEGSCSFIDLEIHPPLDAKSLAELWRLASAFGVTTDVHMSSWRLAVRVERRLESGDSYRTFASPMFGRYRVEAVLVGRPTASAGYSGERFGPSTAYDLAHAEGSVRGISFWLPRS